MAKKKKVAKKKPAPSMAKEVAETESNEGDQMPLIDELTEKTKPIVPAARKYHKTIKQRLVIQKREADEKEAVRNLVRNSGLLPTDDDEIVFVYQDIEVIVTPQDEKVKVKIKGDS